MSRFSTVAIISLTLLGAAGCASKQEPVEAYSQVTASWIGRPESSLISSWGVPSKTEHLADGGQADQYDVVSHTGEITCTTIFTTDPVGKLQKVSSTGTDCHAPVLGGPKS